MTGKGILGKSWGHKTNVDREVLVAGGVARCAAATDGVAGAAPSALLPTTSCPGEGWTLFLSCVS